MICELWCILNWGGLEGAVSSAREAGFVMPAEWEPVEAIWLSWPLEPGLWPGVERSRLEGTFCELAELIGRFAEVRVCIRESERGRIESLLNNAEIPAFQIYGIATDDVWCRDHGATFVKNRSSGEVAAVDWVYNGWGEKFPHQRDAQVARRMVESRGLRHFRVPFVCEGGAVDVNGQGLCLTTESVLLNPNRNPKIKKAQVNRVLRDALGAKDVIWLPAGLDNDDTDGHIDMVARFVSEKQVVMVEPTTENLVAGRVVLENAGLEVISLPGAVEVEQGVAGSYANFLIVNEGVIVPQFGKEGDEKALQVMKELYPEKEVVGFDCSLIGQEGGGVHCLTQGQWS